MWLALLISVILWAKRPVSHVQLDPRRWKRKGIPKWHFLCELLQASWIPSPTLFLWVDCCHIKREFMDRKIGECVLPALQWACARMEDVWSPSPVSRYTCKDCRYLCFCRVCVKKKNLLLLVHISLKTVHQTCHNAFFCMFYSECLFVWALHGGICFQKGWVLQ